MKRILVALPFIGLVAIFGCSTEKAEESEAKEKVKKVMTPVKPLIERNSEVKDYFETMNEIVDAYLSAGESVMTLVEQLESEKLDYLESALAVQSLVETWSKIEDISVSLDAHEELKKTIEKKLNPKDVLEFSKQYNEAMERWKALTDRMAESSLKKYLPN